LKQPDLKQMDSQACPFGCWLQGGRHVLCEHSRDHVMEQPLV